MEEQTDPSYTVIEPTLLINPYSENIDIAILYLEYIAEHMEPSAAISLFPDVNEPIENDHSQEWIDNGNQYIAELQERLTAADETNQAALQEELEEARLNQERLEARRWAISAQQIAAYRERAPFIVLNADNVLSTSSINEIITRYLQGTLTVDGYVDELEQRLRLMRLED